MITVLLQSAIAAALVSSPISAKAETVAEMVTPVVDIAPTPANPLTIYTGRHYDTDRQLYDLFTEQTGIPVSVVEGKDDALLERLKAEGKNTEADVFITVDAGRLWRAAEAGLYAPIESDILEDAIPANVQDGQNRWFGFAKRARVLVYDKKKGPPAGLSSYEALASPVYHEQICVRSSNNIYNQSLVASMIAAQGEHNAEHWVQGLVYNFARKPRGNDRDQMKAVLNGDCAVAIVNTYYIPRMGKKQRARLGVLFPNQDDRGAHVNVSGAGVVAASNSQTAAQKFLEFLASVDAQKLFAEGNNEFPVVKGVAVPPSMAMYGTFKDDKLSASTLGKLNQDAVKVMDRGGWR